jgi:hypothetical protein
MTSPLDRRLARLEGPSTAKRTYILAPRPCKTTKEWLERMKAEKEGRGKYVLGPVPIWPNCVRWKTWVPDEEPAGT